jgi:TonB-dependent receptor
MNASVVRDTRDPQWCRLLRWIAALAFLCVHSVLTAQSGAGTLEGTVINEATGELLAGATVQVEGTSQRTVTSRGGSFTLSLPPGTHTVLISYAGLDTARATIEMQGETKYQRFLLNSEVYSMEKFVVAGVREGRARALQEQQNSLNPKLVAAMDNFGNPPANPGELVQRMPGVAVDFSGSEIRSLYIRGLSPQFSALMVDGERTATSTGTSVNRNYQIEQYGTGNLETIELIRAPSLDQDANAIVGFVNLVTKRAFDVPERRISATVGTMWRHRRLSNSPDGFKDDPELDLLALSYSDAFSVNGGTRNLGVAFNVNRRVSATTSDESGVGFGYGITDVFLNPNSTNPLTRVFGSGDFGAPAIAHNAGLSVDYKAQSGLVLYGKVWGNNNYQYQKYLRSIFGSYEATTADFAPGSTYEHSVMLPSAPGSLANLESAIFTKKSVNYGLSGGAEMKLFDDSATLEVRGSYSHANIEYPGWIRAQGSIPSGIGFEIDRRGQDPWNPIFTQTAGPSIYNPASYKVDSIQHRTYEAPDDLFGARVDFTKNLASSRPMSVKAGLKYNDDQREQNPNFTGYTWVGADGVPGSADDVLTPYASSERYNQGDGRYGPFPYMTVPWSRKAGDPMAAPDSYRRQTAADAYNSYASSRSSDAEFRERVTAAYVQGSVDFGRLTVLGGVRVEETRTEGTGWVRNTTADWGGNSVGGGSFDPAVVAANVQRAQRSFVRRLTTEGKYRDVFPGVHVVYKPSAGWVARASFNRSISRPPVGSLLPIVTENATAGTVSLGNAGLKPFHSNNFELGIERYFEPVGLFSIGAFYKDITDYSRTFVSVVPAGGVDGSGLYAGYRLTTSQNVGDAMVRGIELSYQQQFSFLPGPLKGLGAFANFTKLQTEGNYGGTVTTKQLADFAPRTANAGINYTYRGLDVRVLANWLDKFYTYTEVDTDVYYKARLILDVKVQYSISPRLDLFLDINNIQDTPSRGFITNNGLHFYKANEGVGFVAGIRGKF